MNKLERQYRLREIFREMRVVPTAVLQERLGHISRATLTRYLNELTGLTQCPIVFDRDAGGYRLAPSAGGGLGELPGLWFSAEEIHALLTMHQLLQALGGGGLLGPHLAPLKQRITALLGAAADSAQEVTRRVRLETLAARSYQLEHFEAVGSALLRRQQLRLDYHARSHDRRSQRQVSPQRLTHYRDNWYLDAWCHRAEDLRRFALDAIRQVTVLPIPALDMDEAQLEHRLASGYGAFAGDLVHWAVLRFSPERSRWVAEETWHRDQQGQLNPDGSYTLRLPYNHTPELVMDILRHGHHVTVLSPPELATTVRDELMQAGKNYSGCSGFEHGGGENAGRLKPEQT